MIYGSVCSGIEAATVAWHPLGWRPAWFSEIDSFPSAVLKHHYPEVPNHGDFTAIGRSIESDPVDLLVGGTPCQSFSVAGKRLGLDDPRGNLAIEYALLAKRLRARWVVWENVPGVLSSWSDAEEGQALETGEREAWQRNDFDTFLNLLGECGYGLAWRILDAQYYGVPQRRRRVFVVGHLGDWRPAAAVLFERESLRGYPAPRRKAGQGFTYDVAPCLTSGGRGIERTGETRGQDPVIAVHTTGDGYWREGLGTLRARAQESHEHLIASTGEISHCLNAGGMGRIDYESETLIAHALRGEGFDASEDGTGRGTPIVPVSAIGFYANDNGRDATEDLSPTAASGGSSRTYVADMAVRRLTPRECERLQGFPDDYTLIPIPLKAAKPSKRATRRATPKQIRRAVRMAKDGPRYKALGNSMAVPCMAWIGQRIQQVDQILKGA